MNFNRNEHSSFVQRLDKAAEKNPLLWLPCVLMIALALAGEHFWRYAKIAYLHRNTEKVIKEKPQLERKPPALRGVAVSLVIALSFMIMPDFSFDISAAEEELSVNVKAAYARVLTGESGRADSFDLYDMDGDGIDELFVMYGADRGKLFTYNGSGVTLLGDLTAYGGFVMFDGKYLASYGEVEETPKISVKRGDSLYCVMREFKDIRDDSDKSHYEVNGEEVGFEDFRKAMEPLMKMKREAVGMRYSLNAASIEAVLGADSSENLYTAYMSSNVGSNNYINAQRWTDPTYSYISECADGSAERVEYISDTGVVVERYSEDGNVTFQKVITPELPLFGGAFIGNDNNFLVFGQENRDQDNSVEVMRVVKYSKSWERLESVPLRGENTCVPFDGGSLCMDEAGDYLVIHTCHEMYKSSDGYNHQANMTFVISKSDMSVKSSYSGIMNITYGYVSHSFNQFVKTDGSFIYRLDHGDANPRSVILTKAPVTGVTLVGDKRTNLLGISGNKGDNDTGVSVGGFEMSDHGFIAAGNTVDQNNDEISRVDGQRNVFVAVSDSDLKNNKVTVLTNYVSGVLVGNPFLVKIDNANFAVLWEETKAGETVTRLAVVDGSGNVRSTVKSINCRLSDCQPVLTSDGNIMWYYTDNSAPVFVKINTEGQPVSTDVHIHDYGRGWRITDGEHYLVCECGDGQNVVYRHFSDYGVVTREPTADTAGEMTYSCFVCGKFMHKEEIPPTEHEHEFGTEWKYDENGHWHECTVCGGKSELIPHDFEKEIITEASVTAKGKIKFSCKVCDYYYFEDTDPIECEHEFGTDWEYNGSGHWHKCTLCGEKSELLPHNFETEVINDATETSTGIIKYSCTECDYSYTKTIPVKGHEYDMTEWKKNATDHWHECIGCGHRIDVNEHTFQRNVTVEPTDTTSGEAVYTCSECGYSFTKEIPPIGHEHQYDTDAWKYSSKNHWHECLCGEKSETAPHNYIGNVILEPSENTTGIEEFTCTYCGYSYTVILPTEELESYTITIPENVTVTRGNEILKDGDTVKNDDVLNISVDVPDGYVLGSLIVNGNEIKEFYPYTYTVKFSDVIISVLFNENYTITIPDHVTVTRGNEILHDGDTVNTDDVLNISVDVPNGYVLGSLIVNGNEIKEFYPYTYTVKFSDVIVSVLFNENYTITIPNHVTVTRGNEILHDGDTVNTDDVLNISVDVPNGYVLGSLIVNGNEIKDFYPYTYTVKFSDVIVSVLFNENYTITIPDHVTVTRGNEVLKNGDIVNTDDVLNISVDVPDGYSLKSLLVNGNEISDFYPYSYSVKFGDVIIAVDFVKNNVHTHNLSSVYSYDKTGHWFACSGCDEKVRFALHTEASKVTVQPTTTSKGERTYYCLVCGYVIRTEEIPSIPEIHTHTFGTSWKEDSFSHWHECVCGEKADIASHIENSGVITVQPTAYSSGTKTYSCIVCGYTMRTETIPPTYVDPYPSYPSYPFIPDYPVYYPSPSVPSDSIEITLECDLNGISEGKVHFSTKKVFFRNSAIIRVTSTDAADEAASMAVDYLRGGAEHNIIYPFDISVYDADTYEEIQLKERGYITFEIPVPDILSDKTNEISVYHIADGKPELLKSRIVVKSGVNKIRFTADSFSPYMFAAYSETAMEDVSSAAGIAANSMSIDFAGPTTNGVGIPTARLPKIMEFSNKKRRYRILRKRRLDDLVFVY